QGLGKVPPRLGQLTGARFELLFQLDQRIGPVANARSRLRSGRTKLAAACWILCAFERQGHLVGTATGPPFRSAQPRIEPTNPNRTARRTRAFSLDPLVGAGEQHRSSRPSALAVLRLITSSYLVGACTGRSAGFSPL